MIEIDIEVEEPAWRAALPGAEEVVRKAALAALSAAATGPEGARLAASVLLADDGKLRALNARFRNRDAATNVLSFPAPAQARPHLGDVALAFGVCAREAGAQGKSLEAHTSHLTAHGVLHLLGYDHETEADAEVMEGLERAILADLGFPDPYETDAEP